MLSGMFKRHLKSKKTPIDVFNLWVKLFESHDFKTLHLKIRKSELNPYIPTINGLYPLHLACIQGNINAVNFLLEYGVSINVKSNMGKTPIDEAKFYEYTDCVDVLIEAENIENNIKEMDFEGLFNFYY
jgi:ankyrin repeat protein